LWRAAFGRTPSIDAAAVQANGAFLDFAATLDLINKRSVRKIEQAVVQISELSE
jgi:hypothetical protein